jgi:hypothetical protein
VKTLRVRPDDLPLIVELIPETGAAKQYLLKVGGRRSGLLLNVSEHPKLSRRKSSKKEIGSPAP